MRDYTDTGLTQAMSESLDELIGRRRQMDLCETRLLEAGIPKADLPTMVWKLVCENERLRRLDPERERRIEEWVLFARGHRLPSHEIDEAVALMRSAPPAADAQPSSPPPTRSGNDEDGD